MGSKANKIEMPTGTIVRFNGSVTRTQTGRIIERLASNNARPVFLATFILLCSVTGAFAQNNAADPQLKIDIPTKLEKSNVVIDFGHAVFNGDAPFALGDINLLANDLRAWNAKGAIVVIFHGDAAYLVLNDETYNANRHTANGNPYKKLLTDLMALGVQLELCGATAKANHWGNASLLPGIKVSVNAMVRLTQLEQDGYTMIYQLTRHVGYRAHLDYRSVFTRLDRIAIARSS